MFFLEPTLFSSTLHSTGLAHIIGKLRGGVSVDRFIYYFSCLYIYSFANYQTFLFVSPLTYFVLLLCFHRMIQSAFVDMESMFDLLTEEEEVSGHCGHWVIL